MRRSLLVEKILLKKINFFFFINSYLIILKINQLVLKKNYNIDKNYVK